MALRNNHTPGPYLLHVPFPQISITCFFGGIYMNKFPIFPSVMQATCPDFSMLVGKIFGGLFIVQLLVLVGAFLQVLTDLRGFID